MIIPSLCTRLSAVIIVTRCREAVATIFSRKQRPSSSFDHLKLGIDLVGAVEIDVQCGDVVQLAGREFSGRVPDRPWPRWSRPR